MAKQIGYKCMAYEDGKAVSLANKELAFDLRLGANLSMSGDGVYLSNSRDLVVDYYTGITDNDEVLLTLEYDDKDLIDGNLLDKESELTVKKAKIIGAELFVDGDFVEQLPLEPEVLDFSSKLEMAIAKEKDKECSKTPSSPSKSFRI